MAAQSGFYVVLRQNLVRWRFQAQLADLVRACGEFGVDEVLIFPHPLNVLDAPTGYYPLEEVRADCELLARAKAALDRAGVRMGLNVWHTLGHGDFGRDMTGVFPFQPLVDAEGVSCKACACPLSKEWQEYIVRVFELYASVQPSRIFLDDDFRWHNHSTATSRGAMTCFCRLHLGAFNARHRHNHTRESLLREVLRPGPPSPVRAQWLDFLGESLTSTAALIERAVHRISPETEMGLMCSAPDNHAIEGRDWRRLTEALCGRGRVALLRPTFPPYEEDRLRDIPTNLLFTRHTIAQMPRGSVIPFPELDNWIPTPFNRSPDYIAFQTMMAAVLGIGQFHYSLFEFLGNPDTFADGREYGDTLRRIRPHVEKLLSLAAGARRERGVQLLNNPRSAYTQPTTNGRDWSELRINSLAMGGVLQLLGFPVTFDESPVVAATGAILSTLDDAQVAQLLSKAVLLESSAVELLVTRGFGKQIGVRSVRQGDPAGRVISAEKIVDPADAKCGQFVRCLTVAVPRERFLVTEPEARVLTTMVGFGGEEQGPGTVLFENDRGGRVALWNADAAEIDSLMHLSPLRQHLLGRVMDYLQDGEPHISVRHAPLVLPLHVETDDDTLIAIGNVRTAEATEMEIVCCNLPARSVEGWLFCRGELRPLRTEGQPDSRGVALRVCEPVPPLGIAIVKLGRS